MNHTTKRLRIKPSIRDKRRYFYIDEEHKNIEEAILEYLGILGFSKAAYKKVFVEGEKRTIGSCLVASLNDIRAALALKGMKIDKVSGTIKGLTG